MKELSNHNERSEERKGALVELLKITREDSMAVWDEHFKTILLLLLETLGDKDVRNLIVCVHVNPFFLVSFICVFIVLIQRNLKKLKVVLCG